VGEPRVTAVHRSAVHGFNKYAEDSIFLVEGIGVQGDAHAGTTVQHRSRVARNPNEPNLRQVHLIHSELFDELMAADFAVWPGDLGENITTKEIDLLALPCGLWS
jgi:MOSC domain-containing protein YiiM